MNKALAIIEEVYEIALNPSQDYFAQLEPLAPNGELANRTSANKVLFKLCQLVDAQEKEIQQLKEKDVDNAKKILEPQNTIPDSKNEGLNIVNDPTKPLG